MKQQQEVLVSSRPVFTGKIISVKVDTISLPNGATSEREVVMHPGGAVILAIDPAGCIVLVEQYRHAIGRNLLELPAGRLNQGEDLEVAARRELREETGYSVGKMTYLLPLLTAPGFTDERLHLFLAEDLRHGEQDLDSDEFVSVVHVTPSKLKNMVLRGEITDCKTIAALGMIFVHRPALLETA